MKVLFRGQVPKDLDYPEAIEDAVEIDPKAGRIAISDGASESFDSSSFAEKLVFAYNQNPKVDINWLSEVVQKYNASYEPSSLSWSKQAAFERGSFATLLAVEECHGRSTVDVLSVGDSIAVLLDGSKKIYSFPYNEPEEFEKRPELFCTKLNLNEFICQNDFNRLHLKVWELKELEHPRILCMTDAIGEWALRMALKGMPQWEILISIRDNAELTKLVVEERSQNRMRVDDVTLVNAVLGGVITDELPLA